MEINVLNENLETKAIFKVCINTYNPDKKSINIIVMLFFNIFFFSCSAHGLFY